MDLDAFIGASINDVCAGLNIKTVFIKSKASAAITANLEDLVEPIQLDFSIGFFASASATPILCNGGNSTITVTANGGVGPFSYSIDNGAFQPSNTFVVTAGGPYILKVKDSNNCISVSTTISITQPTALELSVSSTNESCNGDSNGTVTATSSGGTPGYTYTITGSSYGPVNNGTGVFHNLPAGNYTITVNDANNCSKSTSAIVTTFDIPVCNISGLEIVCPGSIGNLYVAPAGMDSYDWAIISGSAQIIGASNQASVLVDAPLTCGSYTLELTVTKNGCSSKCIYVVDVIDETAPGIIGVGPNQTIECSEAVVFSNPTFTDNCTLEPIFSYEDVIEAGACAGNYVATRTWVVIDACGNSTQLSQTITVQDTTAPVSDLEISEITVECGDAIPGFEPKWTDNCDMDLELGAISTIGIVGCNQIISEVYYAKDDCGNIGSVSRSITIVDTTAPSSNLQSEEITVECGDDTPAFNPIWTDACDAELELSAISGIAIEGCGEVVFQTYSAMDDCGNNTSINRTIHYVDTTNPVLHNIPADTNADCSQIPGVPTSVFATDICDNSVTVEFEENTEIIDACTYKIIRTWTATDDCENSVSQSQIITVTDELAPVISSGPPTQYIECDEDLPVNDPVFYDLCDQDLTIEFSTYNEIVDCIKIIHNSWTATDDCDNSAVVNALIYVLDTTPPSLIGVPDDAIAECDNIPAVANVTAEDNCDTELEFTFTESNPVYLNCGYYFLRTWTVKDDCGNEASATQMITVVDTQAPTADVENVEITIECGESYESMVINWTDNCDQDLELSAISAIGFDGCNKVVSEVYYAEDDCGNIGSVERIIHIVDTTAPTANLQSEEITVECGDETPPFNIIWTDACDAELELSAISGIAIEGCGEVVFQTYSATDDCGNASSVNRTIHYVDTTEPVLHNVPADLTAECGQIPGVSTSVFATDICDNSVVIVYTETIEPGDACTYYIIRTWTATDDCENSTSLSQTITVSDNTPPAIHNVPENTTASCDNIPGVSEVVFATDNCSDPLLQFTSEETFGCPYTITRTWTAIDECGNETVASQIITVIDDEAPVLHNVPQNFEGQCGDIPSVASVTVTDNCDDNAYIVYDETPLSDICPVQILRTWTAYDNCGNSAYSEQLITISDTEDPILIGVPANATVECDNIPAPAEVTVEDNCASDLEVIYTESQPVYLNCGYYFIRNWYVVDYCGNEALASQMITVTDTTTPVADLDDTQITVECGDEIPGFDPNWTDNCDLELELSAISAIGFDGCTQIISEVYSAKDDCGNVGSVSRTIYIVDTTAPTANIQSEEITVECGDDTPEFNLIWNDACDAELELSAISGIGIEDCGEVVFQTYSAMDDCGNASSVNRTIHYTDTTPPTITCPANIAVICADDVPASNTSDVEATDNCSDVTVTVNEVISGYECVNHYTITRTYTATDACGNSASCDQIITVNDNIAPVFTYVPQSSANCGEAIGFGQATATDNCGGTIEITFEDSNNNNDDDDDDNCQYTTYSKGGWGSPSNSGPGSYRDANFDGAFPTGLTIGCATGSYLFTSAQAIEDFIPSGGGSAALPAGVTVNPTAGNTDNNFADQLVAATLNVGFDGYDPNFGASAGFLGDLLFANGTFAGMSASSVIQIANDVIGGCSNAYSPNVLLSAMEDINLSFHEGTTNSGDLLCGDGGNNNVCDFQVTRTWTATDLCGNTSTATTVINISDNENPTVEYSPADISVQCEDDVVISEPIFSDDCDTELTIVPSSSIALLEPCGYLIHKSWTATDNCGNSVTANQNITVQDTQSPVLIGVPANVSAECGELPAIAEVNATDNCDENIEVIYSESGVQDGCYYNITRTWTATDACGNETSASQTIVVGDNTAPYVVEASPSELWIECNQDIPVLEILFGDNCDNELTYLPSEEVINSSDCGYDIQRTITATDDCGNSTTFTQIIHVGDYTPPVVLWAPENLNIDCNGEVPALEAPQFSDNCDDELNIEYVLAIADMMCGYAYIHTWIATDNCGNSTEVVQEVTVSDTEAPVVDPYEVSVHLECDLVDSYIGITATDNCGEITITYTDMLNSGGCLGTIIRTYLVKDECGNSTIVQQYISIQDTHGPVIMNPADQTVECNEAPTSIPDILIYDACGMEVEILEASQEIVVIDECSYQIIWHWIAMDYCENVSEATTVITVTDTTNPTFSNVSEDMWFSCEDDFVAPAAPTASDNCDDNVEIISGQETIPGSCPQNYDIIYVWRAVDNCGNATVVSTLYHISDYTAPDFGTNNQINFNYECNEDVELIQPSATDNCGIVSYTHEDINSWSQGCSYGFTRVWTATDECENSSAFMQFIVIEDTIAPEVEGEVEITIPCDEFGGVYITATDNCNEVDIDYSDESVSGSCAGKYIRTYYVSDGCGNTTTFTQIITLIDVTAPQAVNPVADLTIECGDDYESYSPEFTDNCDQELVIEGMSSIAVSEDGCTTIISESWSATDDCNNTTVVSRTITIVDTTAPTFDALPEDMSYNCSDLIDVAVVTASDVCDLEVEVSYTDEIEEGNCPANYVIVRTWTAEDNCGNVASYVQYITVADNEAPDFIYVPLGGIYSCEDNFIIDEPVTYDLCSEVDVTFEDVYDYYCNNSYSLTRNWTATDACGNISEASATYYVYDDVAPQFDQDLSDVTVECSDDIPAPVNATATDNCGNAVVTVEIIPVDEDNCGHQTLYVSYTATDDCENSSTTGYYIYVEDTTEPTLIGCPNDLVLSCTDALPAPAIVTAEDNCDENIFVDYEEFFIGDQPAAGSIADCNLLTPVRPANNPCSYSYDWAMVMFGLPNTHKYYTVENGNLVQYPNGTAHITATMHNVLNPANGWNIDLWFNGGMNWNQWSTQAFQTGFKGDCGGEAINHIDWTYFILQAGPGAELNGFGAYAGSTLNLNHAPSNHYFGFQMGNGANNYNGVDNGFGGWFSYSGFFQVNNTPYGNNQGTISGAGDLAFELDCCPQYSVVRQWTAVDCSGNASTCVQNISFAPGDVVNSPVVPAVSLIASNKEIVLSLSPNPAIDKAVFTFIPVQSANTTIEVFDMAGAKITGFDLGVVDAGVEYKVNYDVSKLATGLYSYRVINGMAIKTGKLVVGK